MVNRIDDLRKAALEKGAADMNDRVMPTIPDDKQYKLTLISNEPNPVTGKYLYAHEFVRVRNFYLASIQGRQFMKQANDSAKSDHWRVWGVSEIER